MNNDHETTEMIKQAVKVAAILASAFVVGVVGLALIGISNG